MELMNAIRYKVNTFVIKVLWQELIVGPAYNAASELDDVRYLYIKSGRYLSFYVAPSE